MLVYLILLFTIVPVVELAILLKVGHYIGLFNTIAVVIFTGVSGAFLAKSQGLMILKKIKENLESGIMPGDKLIDGALILVGGILLLTPGFITDIIGFTVLIPYTRYLLKVYIIKKMKHKISPNRYIDVNGKQS